MRGMMASALALLLCAGAAPCRAEGLTLGGELTLETQVELDDGAVFPSGILELKLDYGLGNLGLVRLMIEGADREEDPFLVRQAYLDLYLKEWDFRLGKQRIAWGTTDLLNPTDNLNPIDYTRPFEEENKLGTMALRADRYFGDWQLELVWLPVFVPAELPEAGERWYSSSITLPAGFTTLVVEEADAPDETLANSECALRLAGRIKSVDVSFSYFNGWDDLPAYHAALAPPVMTISPRYHRLQVFGADFAATKGRWGFRGEAAYFLTDDRNRVDPAVKNPYAQVVLGVEYTVGEKYYLELQAVGQFARASLGLSDTDEGDSYGLTLVGRWKPHPDLELSLGWISNLTGGDQLIRPQLEYSIADGITLSAGAVFLSGAVGTTFGDYAGNDYAYLKLSAAF